jgi:hypothetical protein
MTKKESKTYDERPWEGQK